MQKWDTDLSARDTFPEFGVRSTDQQKPTNQPKPKKAYNS